MKKKKCVFLGRHRAWPVGEPNNFITVYVFFDVENGAWHAILPGTFWRGAAHHV